MVVAASRSMEIRNHEENLNLWAEGFSTVAHPWKYWLKTHDASCSLSRFSKSSREVEWVTVGSPMNTFRFSEVVFFKRWINSWLTLFSGCWSCLPVGFESWGAALVVQQGWPFQRLWDVWGLLCSQHFSCPIFSFLSTSVCALLFPGLCLMSPSCPSEFPSPLLPFFLMALWNQDTGWAGWAKTANCCCYHMSVRPRKPRRNLMDWISLITGWHFGFCKFGETILEIAPGVVILWKMGRRRVALEEHHLGPSWRFVSMDILVYPFSKIPLLPVTHLPLSPCL